MTVVLAHARASVVELARYPSYVVPTLLFPGLFFLFFAASARGADAAVAMCSFGAYAVIGVAFFQFGVGIAAERASPWETYLRTLPVSPPARVAARLIAAVPFAAASAAAVVTAALPVTGAALPLSGWVALVGVLALGIVPFALFGIALGDWASPRGALPIANLLYLGLAYAGGLWMEPTRLPRVVESLSTYLPTRPLADAVAGVVAGSAWDLSEWAVLAAYAVFFAAASVLGYRRDEGRRYE